jgi:ABC-type sugar transport system ATPase subunit
MAGLKLSNIHKAFDENIVLKNISLELAEGELLVLLGPSGCGKSTLLRIIAGLETADSGEIKVSDTRIDQKEPKDRNVALVFQNYALYPHMTVEKNLSFPLRIAGTDKKDITKKVTEVAALLGLTEKLNQRPGRLSGGERQRVALGRAIIKEPSIFLLDEPLSNLDAELRSRMRREIVSLQKRLKKTMVHVTHDQTEALTMADTIALMNKGEIIQVGSPEELYQNPVDLFTARFIGYPPINIVRSSLSNGTILPLGMPFPTPSLPESFHLGIRAEDLVINQKGRFEGRVESCEYLGGQILLGIDSNETKLISISSPQNIPPGNTLRFDISPERLLFFDELTSKRIYLSPL